MIFLFNVVEEKFVVFSLLTLLSSNRVIVCSDGMCQCVKWLAGVSWAINGPRLIKVELGAVLLLCHFEFDLKLALYSRLFLESLKPLFATRGSKTHLSDLKKSHTHIFRRWNSDLIFRKDLRVIHFCHKWAKSWFLWASTWHETKALGTNLWEFRDENQHAALLLWARLSYRDVVLVAARAVVEHVDRYSALAHWGSTHLGAGVVTPPGLSPSCI